MCYTAGLPDLRAQDHKSWSGPCTVQQVEELSGPRLQSVQYVACRAADANNEHMGTKIELSMHLMVAQLNSICGESSLLQ